MRKVLFFLLFCNLLIVAACGSGDDGDNNDNNDNAPRQFSITLTPMPIQNIVAGCTQTDLEDWFEQAYFRTQSFIDESRLASRSAENDRRNDTLATLDVLIVQRDALARVPTPACTEEKTMNILAGMQAVIIQFQRFLNNEIAAEVLAEAVIGDIQNIEAEFDELLGFTSELYEQ